MSETAMSIATADGKIKWFLCATMKGGVSELFYIMYGQNNFSLQEEFKKIKECLGNPEMLEVSTNVLDGRQLRLSQLRDVCDAAPFLHQFRLVIVEGLLERFEPEKKSGKRPGKSQSKSEKDLKEWKELSSYIKKMPKATILVLIAGKLDAKKNSLLKHIISVAEVKIFPELEEDALRQWIKKRIEEEGGRVSGEAIDLLIEIVGSDLWTMKSEIEKLLAYSLGQPITKNDVRQVGSYAREANIFAFIDMILEGQRMKAQEALQRLLLEGEAPPYVLVMITRQLRLILLAKGLNPKLPEQEAMERLGIKKVKELVKVRRQARIHTVGKIKIAYHKVLEADLAMKTGKYDSDLAVELLVMDLCKT